MSQSESSYRARHSRLFRISDERYVRAELVTEIRVIRVRTKDDPPCIPFSDKNVYSGHAVLVELDDSNTVTVPCDSEADAIKIARVLSSSVNDALI